MPTSTNTEPRKQVAIKMRPSERELIDYAASLTGKNRTEFVIQSALRSAEETILDQTVFKLDDASMAAFQTALDAPVGAGKVRNLFIRKAPWN